MITFLIHALFVRPLAALSAFKHQGTFFPTSIHSDGSGVILAPQSSQASDESLPSAFSSPQLVVDSTKTSGADSGPDHSSASAPLPSPVIDSLPLNHSRPDASLVCQSHLVFLDRFDRIAVSPKPCQGKRVETQHLLNIDWFFQSGVRVVAKDGPAAVQMCGKHREFYQGRSDGRKCQYSECFELGIPIEFRGRKISECPIHLQARLGKSPAQVVGDLLSDRLTNKRRRKEEVHGRVLASHLSHTLKETVQHDPLLADLGTSARQQCETSGSSNSSLSHMPGLADGLSGDEEERPHVPTPPIRETVTWGDPSPAAPAVPPSSQLKEQALHLVHRTPPRRGSLVDSAGTQTGNGLVSTWCPPPISGRFVPSVSDQPATAPQHSTVTVPDGRPDAARSRNDTVGLEVPQVGSPRSLAQYPYPVCTRDG